MSRLEALKKSFTEKTTSGGNANANWRKFYQFWKMPDDTTAVVRFLPDADADNPFGFLIENFHHELNINGDKKIVPCINKLYGKKCPICEKSRHYYDVEKNDELGKKYYVKKSYIGQILIVESPFDYEADPVVKLIEFGYKIFNTIQTGFKSGDLENDPDALKGGYNFRIKKTKSGKWADYSTSSFAPKQTDVSDDVIAQIELYNLKDFRTPEMDYDTLEQYLLADLTGADAPSDAGHEKAEDAPAPKAAPKAAPAPKAEEPEEDVAPASAPAGNSKAAEVLARLRARNKAE